MSGQRSLKNFLLHPIIQFRYVFLIFTILLLGLGLLQAFVIFNFGQTIVRISEEFDLQSGMIADINERLDLARLVLVVSFLFIWCSSIVLGIYLTHRFLGPAVQLQRMIASLRAGNYSVRVQLRKGDEFQDLMGELNGLAAELEKKHST